MARPRVLIAYATRYGSTEETAKDLTTLFGKLDTDVEVVDLKKKKEKNWPSIDNYDGIIVASGIKIGRWMKEPQKFLVKHKDAITSKNKLLAIFVSCMSCLTEPETAKVKYLEKIIEDLGIKPELYVSFGPILDFTESSKMGFFNKAILKKVAKDDLDAKGISINYEARNDLRKEEDLQDFVNRFVNLLKERGS